MGEAVAGTLPKVKKPSEGVGSGQQPSEGPKMGNLRKGQVVAELIRIFVGELSYNNFENPHGGPIR